jgi:hypothetical protein
MGWLSKLAACRRRPTNEDLFVGTPIRAVTS